MLDLFEKYRLKEESLLDYGFVRSGAEYSYSTEIMAGDFQMNAVIFDGKLDFQVLDLDTGDEYRQVKMESMAGEFVGQVRAACQEVLLDIRQHCFEEVGFLYEQSQRLSTYVATTYQGQLEYLWENSSRILPRSVSCRSSCRADLAGAPRCLSSSAARALYRAARGTLGALGADVCHCT